MKYAMEEEVEGGKDRREKELQRMKRKRKGGRKRTWVEKRVSEKNKYRME